MSKMRIELNGATMGTRYTATFYAPPTIDKNQIAAQLAQAVGAVDAQMSNWKEDSDLSRLNRAAPHDWVVVSKNLAALLTRALKIGAETDNAFNIGVGDLVGRWGFGPPGQQRIVNADPYPRAPVDQLIEVDERTCRVRKRGAVTLDLCGIAKGFGVDELGRVLNAHGIDAWLAGIDGEMRARGRKPDGAPWAIALEAPDDERRGAMGVIELTDAAIATSGDYRHWADIDGQRISHTMDPRTGAPLQVVRSGGVASVTVVAPTCADADAYATALMVLGERAGLDCARRRGLDALFIVRDGKALRSAGTGSFAESFSTAPRP